MHSQLLDLESREMLEVRSYVEAMVAENSDSALRLIECCARTFRLPMDAQSGEPLLTEDLWFHAFALRRISQLHQAGFGKALDAHFGPYFNLVIRFFSRALKCSSGTQLPYVPT